MVNQLMNIQYLELPLAIRLADLDTFIVWPDQMNDLRYSWIHVDYEDSVGINIPGLHISRLAISLRM